MINKKLFRSVLEAIEMVTNWVSSDRGQVFADEQKVGDQHVTVEKFLELLTSREPLVRRDDLLKGLRCLVNVQSGETFVIQEATLNAKILSQFRDQRS